MPLPAGLITLDRQATKSGTIPPGSRKTSARYKADQRKAPAEAGAFLYGHAGSHRRQAASGRSLTASGATPAFAASSCKVATSPRLNGSPLRRRSAS